MSFKKKNVVIKNDSYPCVCVPVFGKTKEEILDSYRVCLDLDKRVNLVEWRIDFFSGWKDIKSVCGISKELYDGITEDRLLILTLRTKKEGGEAEISGDEYRDYLYEIAKNASYDLLDLQYFCLPDPKEDISELKKRGAHIIASHHDFKETPDAMVMENHLALMIEGGADIAKLAVMPNSKKDVIELLDVTRNICDRFPEVPVITMSMGELGKPSRVLSALSGNAVTFGSNGKSSAPGQLRISELLSALDMFHKKEER